MKQPVQMKEPLGEQNEIEKVLNEGKNRKHVETPVKFVTQSSNESSRLSCQSLTDQKDIVTGLRSSTPSLEKQMLRQMVYLKNSLRGEPLRIAERYRLTEAGYLKAREELERKYGGLTRRVRNEMHDIRRYPKITENDTIRLEEYSDKVTSLVTCLKENGSEGDLSEVSAFLHAGVGKAAPLLHKKYHR